jgi:hypothetical protein
MKVYLVTGASDGPRIPYKWKTHVVAKDAEEAMSMVLDHHRNKYIMEDFSFPLKLRRPSKVNIHKLVCVNEYILVAKETITETAGDYY